MKLQVAFCKKYFNFISIYNTIDTISQILFENFFSFFIKLFNPNDKIMISSIQKFRKLLSSFPETTYPSVNTWNFLEFVRFEKCACFSERCETECEQENQ